MSEEKFNVSRRDFLKGAGITAAGAATLGLAGCASQAASTSASASAEAAEASAGASASAAESAAEETSAAPAETPAPAATATDASLPNAAPIAPAPVPSAWDEECDVLVVGLGAGGLVAAGYLADKGLNVIGIEKDYETGGASRHAGTIVSRFGGAADQNEMEYGHPVYPLDVNAFVRIYEEQHQYSVDERLVRSVALAGGSCMDWVMAQPEITLVCLGLGYADIAMISGEQNGVLGLNNTMDQLTQIAEQYGASIRTRNECTQLVQDGDAVVGAIVKSPDGEYSVHTNKAVLFCAGGIGMNEDLMRAYMPSVVDFLASGGPVPSHTGEAMRMGLGVGADVAGFDSWNCWECQIDERTHGGDGNFYHYFWNGARQMFHNPWLIINNRGERMPYFATGVQENFTFGSEIQMGDMSNNASWAHQPGHKVFSICDSHFEEYIEEMVVFPGAGDASRIHLREGDPTIENDYVTNDWLGDVQAAIDRGAIKKADTLEELAEQLGLNPDVVTAAVEKWNAVCEKGEDDEMAWAYDKTWLNPVKDGPFYGAILGGQMGKTGAGLRVDDKLQVMRPDGTLIEGLYANYSTAGGFMGEGTYSELWNGSQNGGVGQSLITGWLAADSILNK